MDRVAKVANSVLGALLAPLLAALSLKLFRRRRRRRRHRSPPPRSTRRS
jgi:uncharacterized protein (DUF2062 family)